MSKALARLNKTMKARNMPTPVETSERSDRTSERPSLSRQETLSKLTPSREATDSTKGFVKTVVATSIGAGTVPRSTQQWAEALEETNPEAESDGCTTQPAGNSLRVTAISRASSGNQATGTEHNSILPVLHRLEAKLSGIEQQLTTLAPSP